MPGDYILVVTYKDHIAGEKCIRRMQNIGFDMQKLSFLGRDYRSADRLVGRYRSNDNTKYWENLSAVGGSAWGALSSFAFFHIPGMGPFLVGGPLASSIIGCLNSKPTDAELSTIGYALRSFGVPKDRVLKYERVLKEGNYVLIVQGTEEEMGEAKAIIRHTDCAGFDLHEV